MFYNFFLNFIIIIVIIIIIIIIIIIFILPGGIWGLSLCYRETKFHILYRAKNA